MTNAVEIRDLVKIYSSSRKGKEKQALGGINLDIPQGSFFGLLGPNGAGKSTMINIMSGLVKKTSGSVTINGWDISDSPRQACISIGVVPQELVVDTFFTVRQALDIHAGYYAVPKEKRRTDEIIEALGLTQQADMNSRRLSGGMRRRLLIAKALVHNPPVLVLDEPTAGVDVELREQLWKYVQELNRNGTTVLLTTHYLEEAQALCDKIAIINHGKVVAVDDKDALMSRVDSRELVFTFATPIKEIPAALGGYHASIAKGGKLAIRYQPSHTQVGRLLADVSALGLEVTDMVAEAPALEDVFRQLTADRPAA